MLSIKRFFWLIAIFDTETVGNGVEWCGTVGNGVERYGMVWNGLE